MSLYIKQQKALEKKENMKHHAIKQKDQTEHIMIHNNTRKILFLTVVMLVLIALAVYGFNHWIPENMGGANVGGGSRLNRIVNQRRKPPQCIEDKDCPYETRCNKEAGICTPSLVSLPVTVAELGSGRADEKNR